MWSAASHGAKARNRGRPYLARRFRDSHEADAPERGAATGASCLAMIHHPVEVDGMGFALCGKPARCSLLRGVGCCTPFHG